jgi:hypothetical protein
MRIRNPDPNPPTEPPEVEIKGVNSKNIKDNGGSKAAMFFDT